jgi:hypothetical protein
VSIPGSNHKYCVLEIVTSLLKREVMKQGEFFAHAWLRLTPDSFVNVS